MALFKKIYKRFKAVSLFETIISLVLIMLAFIIVSQTFIWSKENQHQEFKKRIEKRNIRYKQMME